jgi:death on curing protein
VSEEKPELRFFSVQEVVELHEIALQYGGGAPGLRDPDGLDSAVHNPWNRYSYTDCGVHEIAAAYGFALAQSQAFLDGNKRVGALAALTFLELHGYVIEDALPLYDELVGIAEKKASIETLCDCLVKISKPGKSKQNQELGFLDKLLHKFKKAISH